MGMHFGFIVAECEWPELHTALQARCGTLADAAEVSPSEWFDLPTGQDVFHVASVEGRTYVLDPAMVLSADSDLVVAIPVCQGDVRQVR